ncbi:XrtA system polysaccharide chain length determinant [Qipengyuania sp. MTN3-11]|uniref:XrtA system polysaccharide chain length determinant n=1 Tax=Qipengyuania sp. MTN3-11 TaxID=3056557 RepID=UPI0036F3B3B9
MDQAFEEVRAALHSVWNRRWLALAVAWGVCVVGWLVVALIPNSYESNARIFVELDDVLSEQLQIAGEGKQELVKVRQTLASAVNLEKVIRATRLGEDIRTQPEMQAAITKLTENIKVESTQDNLFEISATIGKGDLSDAANAQLAQQVTQKMIDIFREENVAGARGEVADTIVFLDEQLEERKQELEAAEQRRMAFEAENPELIGGTATVSTRLTNLRTEMRGVDADLAAAQSALAAISGQLASTPRTMIVPGQSGGARGALADARSQLAGMRARGLTDTHPDVQSQQRQIALLERQAASEGDGNYGSPNPAYTSLVSIRAERQANLQALQARKAALQSDITAMMAAQASEPAVAAEANRISRDYEVLKTKYDELLKNREEMRLRGDVQTERSALQFQVIDPPTLPSAPASPNRPLLLIGVLFAGLAAGAGTAFAMGRLRAGFNTAESLERALDLPVVGTISRSMTAARKTRERLRMKQFAGGIAALCGLCVVLLAIEFIQVGTIA